MSAAGKLKKHDKPLTHANCIWFDILFWINLVIPFWLVATIIVAVVITSIDVRSFGNEFIDQADHETDEYEEWKENNKKDDKFTGADFAFQYFGATIFRALVVFVCVYTCFLPALFIYFSK